MSSKKLRAFVSSTMQELDEERREIEKALANLEIDAWLFENDAGARPQPIQESYLAEVKDADFYIGVFWNGYGRGTIEEYECARSHDKDCLIYEKIDSIECRDAKLQEFIDYLGDVKTGLTIKQFRTLEELGKFVRRDVAAWQTTRIRQSPKGKSSGIPKTHLDFIELDKLVNSNLATSIKPFQKGRICWGESLTLQSCPELEKGWSLEQIKIRKSLNQYAIEDNLHPIYLEYKSNKSEYNDNDRTRLMLIRDPVAFSDAPIPRLDVQETKWSQVRFYKDRIWTDPSKRAEHIKNVLQGQKINFANSLALLLVVATSDGYVLLTKPTHKVDYYSNFWACSIGEHLDMDDFKGSQDNVAINWVRRALKEELGVTEEGFDLKNIRITAVILESQIVNCSLIGVAYLEYDCRELKAIINTFPRKDYEYDDWEFLEWSDLPKEIVNPTRSYHPSTGLRMLYACFTKFGVEETYKSILAENQS